VKRFSELLTEAALPKKEPAPKAEPTPTESAESLSKKAVNASKTADQMSSTTPYAEQHSAHIIAADAHHAAADAHLTAGQGHKELVQTELHNLHAATHRSVARNHERSAAVYAMGVASSAMAAGKKKTVKEEVEVEEEVVLDENELYEASVCINTGLNIFEALENQFLTELSKTTLASYVKKAAADGQKRATESERDRGYMLKRAHTPYSLAQSKKAAKRLKGVSKAADKLAEEFVAEAIIAARGPRASYDASKDIAAGKARLAQRKAAHLATLSKPEKTALAPEKAAARAQAKKDMQESYLSEFKGTLPRFVKRLVEAVDHLTLRASKDKDGKTVFHDKHGPVTGTAAELKAHVQKSQEARAARSARKNIKLVEGMDLMEERQPTQYEMNLRAEKLKRLGERFRRAMGQDIPNPVED